MFVICLVVLLFRKGDDTSSKCGATDHMTIHEGHLTSHMHNIIARDISTMKKSTITPSDILKRTAIGVKTYNRPSCLQEFITSVRKHAPYITIFVVDDSDRESRMVPMQGKDRGDYYVRLTTDSGSGKGRNNLVEAIHKEGYEYLIMADDDFKLTSADTIAMMAKYISESGADIVAATLCEAGMKKCKKDKGMIILDENKNLTILPNVSVYAPYPNIPHCYRSDLIQKAFMARTQRLLTVKWDDALKNNDHYDFLLSAKQNNLTMLTCSDISVLHEKSCQARSPRGKFYIIFYGVIFYQTNKEWV